MLQSESPKLRIVQRCSNECKEIIHSVYHNQRGYLTYVFAKVHVLNCPNVLEAINAAETIKAPNRTNSRNTRTKATKPSHT